MKINTFQDSKKNKLALLALHGWTGDEFSMEAIANETGPLSAKWYLPRAPYNADTGKGYTWFSGSPETGWKSKKTFNLMDKIFNQIINDGFFPNKIILLGFSMGASLAIRYGLTLDVTLKGIIPIAGMVRDTEELLDSSSIESKQTPILMIHGKKDSVVDYHNSINLAKILKNNGYTSHVEIVESGHIISLRSSRLVKEFINTGSTVNLQLAL